MKLMKKPSLIMRVTAAVMPIYFIVSFWYKPEVFNPIIRYTQYQTIDLPAVFIIVGAFCIYKWIKWEIKGKKEQTVVAEPPPMSGEPISNENKHLIIVICYRS
jgi:hypothetical protein